MDKIRIVSLGGLDEQYKCCMLIEINDDIFVVECGIGFPDVTKPGIDYIIPRYDYLLENKSRVKGYFLTHGHDSVIGALPYIYEKVPAPIYLTQVTQQVLKGFCMHNKLNTEMFDFRIVEPNDDLEIAGHKIQLYSACGNVANSFGIVFNTDQGNIIFISNCIFDNNNDIGFTLDLKRISQIVAANPTLVLFQDSMYASRPGYTNPHHRLLPLVDKIIKDSPGRVIAALEVPDIYNTMNILNYAYKTGHKIVLYDKTTQEVARGLTKVKCLNIPASAYVPIGEVNRIRAQELFILMLGYGKKLFSKVSLLATHKNDEQIMQLFESDTFIIGSHVSSDAERARTEAIDLLYRTNCHIHAFDKPEFLIMHSSAEDLKTALSMFRPRYYIPMQGTFVQLLENAKLALSMNIGLNHNTVFILENGDVAEFESQVAKIHPKKVLTGSLYVDGKGVGDVAKEVLDERQRFSDDGVIILAATISKSKRDIVLGPDIQTRGLIFVKESEPLLKEINRILTINIKQELAKANYSIAYLENNIKEQVFKAVRRSILKSPTIIPIIMEIE